jgi:dienelactone hydrolase
VTETVGTGPQTATIVRPAGDERRPVVLFLHGWGATRPRFYRPWIDHLAREGNAVIYPR